MASAVASRAPGSNVPAAPTKNATGQRPTVPFRVATLERGEILANVGPTALTAATQPVESTIEGNGYYFGVLLDWANTVSGNSAAVAFFEDAPQSALAQVVLRDPSGEIVNLSGFELFLANLAHKNYAVRGFEASSLFLAVTGAGGNGGSMSFALRVPAGINRQSLLGILGNQDRSVKYQLRTDLAGGTASATGPIFTTAPTGNPGSVIPTITRIYENYAVPPVQSPNGAQNQLTPDSFGMLAYLTSTLSEAAPLGGSSVTHYLRRLGNTGRYVILVFRSNNSRATADANAPTRIALKVSDAVVYNETYRYRRWVMQERYGFDFPAGVLVYDFMHDAVPGAGAERGTDWMNLQNTNLMQFEITYPAGFGSTANSLKIITSDMAFVGQITGGR